MDMGLAMMTLLAIVLTFVITIAVGKRKKRKENGGQQDSTEGEN